MVLNKQKEENRRKNRRKKVDSELLNDMDNLISNFISEMKHVANVSSRSCTCLNMSLVCK